jgi:hypothetical protein
MEQNERSNMDTRELHLLEMEFIKAQVMQQPIGSPKWEQLVKKYKLYQEQLKLFDEIVK